MSLQLRYSPCVHKLPNLRRIREDVPMSQEELARASGVNRVTITRLELGLQEARPGTTRALAKALQVKPGVLMGTQEG